MDKTIEELTLLLIYLTSWENRIHPDLTVREAWKGHRFEIIDALEEAGYLGQTRKMVTLTPAGLDKAQTLIEKYLGE